MPGCGGHEKYVNLPARLGFASGVSSGISQSVDESPIAAIEGSSVGIVISSNSVISAVFGGPYCHSEAQNSSAATFSGLLAVGFPFSS